MNAIGNVVKSCWLSLPACFPIRLDEWVSMPNHFHGVIVIEEGRSQGMEWAGRDF